MTPPGDRLTRRDVLEFAAASAFIGAAHSRAASAANGDSSAIRRRSPAGPRIMSLRLRTAAGLAEMKQFYGDLLGFDVVAISEDELTVLAGATAVTFVPARPDEGRPFYHFAFNIPQNKLAAACAWQRVRTSLVAPQPELRDAAYADEVWHFRHWNAHSIFFWDPGDNIVEYIARHELANDAGGPFSIRDILHASEIGFMFEEPPTAALEIQEQLGLAEYPQGAAPWALGDADGLLLCLQRGRVWGRDGKSRTFEEYPTEATIRGPHAVTFRAPGRPFVITAVR